MEQQSKGMDKYVVSSAELTADTAAPASQACEVPFDLQYHWVILLVDHVRINTFNLLGTASKCVRC
jgi:hypothetical protein